VAWRWNARRLFVSAFVIFHLSALSIWTIPPCIIKERCTPFIQYYVLPTGMWQWWAIFAPDPIRNTMVMDAEIIDARGMRHIFEFPRLGDLPWWQKVPRYRQPKFTANMVVPEYIPHRKFTAKHAVRQMGLKPEAYPLVVSLYYHVTDSPAPGSTAAIDPMVPPRIHMLERFEFASIEEVRP
jgi:hypothetical protein